jgi:hypothetical protein
MSDDPPENDPLGLFDDQPKEHAAGSELSPDEIVFLQDLRNSYDNPEIYEDPTLPQVFKLRILNQLLPGAPAIIRLELDGDVLPDALVEGMFGMMSLDPGLSGTLQKFGDKDFEEFRQGFESEEPEKFAQLRQAQSRFFVRHFPRLLLNLYGIGVMSSFLATLLAIWREEPDDELSEVETIARRALENQISHFERIIKEMVGTRASGRPKKIESDSVPKIVKRVLDIANGIMGDARGKDAVPGLKTIADAIGLSEGALGVQLRRVGYPWTMIRTHLESLT